jgi:hypothetical protein
VSRPAGFWRSERGLLALLLVLHTSVTLWLVLDRRLPRGHDMLGNYLLQYLFASETTLRDGIPLWMPYVAHGLPSNWAHTIQAGLFQNALLALGGPPGGTNFLPLFHLGMWLDEIVLILGVWMLGKRFGLSPLALFFSSAAAAGSTLWADQPYWNHRALFAVPLVLALLQGFLEERRSWKLHAGVNLLILQILGNVPYIAFLSGLVVLIHLVVYAAVWRRRLWRTWKGIGPGTAFYPLVLLHAATLAAVWVVFMHGAEGIVQHRHGREADGTVSFDTFLGYGGGTTPARYLELLLGTPPSMEYSLYAGAPVLVLAFLALALRPGRRVLQLGLAAALLFSFSLGVSSLVAASAYQALPIFRYFRYVALAAPAVRLLLVILAGDGFDALVRRGAGAVGPRRAGASAMLGASLATGGLAALVAAGATSPLEILELLKSGRFGMSSCEELRAPGTMLPVLLGSALAAGATALLLFVRPRAAVSILLALLGAADVYRWKLQMLAMKTAPLSDEAYAVQRVEPVPYAPRRSADYASIARYRAMAPSFFDYGVNYDFTDGFLHLDPPSSRFWTHHWLYPVDRLARAYGTKHHGSREAADAALAREHRKLFPKDHPPYDRILGRSQDKLQVFSRAGGAMAPPEVARLLNDPRNRGDLLLLEGRLEGLPGPFPTADPARLGDSDRLEVPLRVVSFGAHRVEVEVSLPQGVPEAWLSYADAWHPAWRAVINGRPEHVDRAFLAYKAVRLGPGLNRVGFRLEDPLRTTCARALGLNALAWVAGVLWALFRVLRPARC